MFDTKGSNTGSTISPLVVDGRFSNQPKTPDEVLNDPEWKALNVQEKQIQRNLGKKKKVIANLQERRSSPKISPLKKAMVLVAIANAKSEAMDIEHSRNMVKYKKKSSRNMLPWAR